jgi:hypothetical protein
MGNAAYAVDAAPPEGQDGRTGRRSSWRPSTARSRRELKLATNSQARELLSHNGGSRPGNLDWALDSVLTRVDRGMGIEIRFLPPPAAPTEAPLEEGHAMAELVQLQSQLVFPRRTHEPARQLPPGEPPHSDDPARRDAARTTSEGPSSASQSTYEAERPLPGAEPPALHLEATLEPTPKKARRTQGSAPKFRGWWPLIWPAPTINASSACPMSRS